MLECVATDMRFMTRLNTDKDLDLNLEAKYAPNSKTH